MDNQRITFAEKTSIARKIRIPKEKLSIKDIDNIYNNMVPRMSMKELKFFDKGYKISQGKVIEKIKSLNMISPMNLFIDFVEEEKKKGKIKFSQIDFAMYVRDFYIEEGIKKIGKGV